MEIKSAYLACLGLGAAQFAVTARLWRRFHRDFNRAPMPYFPSVSVLVACKGDAAWLRENGEAFLNQDYAGKWELLFVVPSSKDPAYEQLKAALTTFPRARLLASESVPRNCSGKNLDLSYGLGHVSADTEVLAFADADARVGSDWLREMVAPLSQGACATTAAMLYAPSPGLWSLLRMVWMGAGIPYFELMGCVTGQSCAIRKKDFQELGIADLWERSLMDDLPLAERLKERGKKVLFAAKAMPFSSEPCGARQFWSQFNRWILAFRLYVRSVWLLGFCVTALKAWILFRGFWPRADWVLPALLFGLDAANLYAVFSIYRRYRPDLFSWTDPLKAALTAPLLQAVYGVNFLRSLWLGDVRWGGVTYRVRGPWDVSARIRA